MGAFFGKNLPKKGKNVSMTITLKIDKFLNSQDKATFHQHPEIVSVFFHAGDRGSTPLGDANKIR
jgi:hypothetical protein